MTVMMSVTFEINFFIGISSIPNLNLSVVSLDTRRISGQKALRLL